MNIAIKKRNRLKSLAIKSSVSDKILVRTDSDIAEAIKISIHPSETLSLLIGDSTAIFPNALSEIVKDINESRAMLDLEFDWDSSGGHAIPPKVWENAAMFLATYSKWIYENEQVVLQSPSINPVADGSIDLTWYTNTARMLINIKNSDNPEAHFYGDLQNDESIKGNFSIDGEVRAYFAQWLRKNLCR